MNFISVTEAVISSAYHILTFFYSYCNTCMLNVKIGQHAGSLADDVVNVALGNFLSICSGNFFHVFIIFKLAAF